MRRKIQILFVLLLFIFSSEVFAQDYFIGVSPPVLNLGELKPGTSEIISFNLVTPSEKEVFVKIETLRGKLEFFPPTYNSLVSNYSEEDSSNWVEFTKNLVELKPKGELRTKAGVIRGWEKVDFILKIPEKAEAGYHTVLIKPIPLIPEEQASAPFFTRVVGVTMLTALFNIPGEAVRSGKILDVVANWAGEKLGVDVLFQNTGTVTMQARASQIKIFNSDGELVSTTASGFDYVRPGETKFLRAYIDNKLAYGDYQVFAEVDYSTDLVSKNTTLKIYPPKLLPPKPKPVPTYFPWQILIAVIIIIFFSYFIYRRIE